MRTEDDACNPAFLQDMWLEKTKVKWEVVDFKSGHMPFFSQPQALAAHIVRIAHGFLTL